MSEDCKQPPAPATSDSARPTFPFPGSLQGPLVLGGAFHTARMCYVIPPFSDAPIQARRAEGRRPVPRPAGALALLYHPPAAGGRPGLLFCLCSVCPAFGPRPELGTGVCCLLPVALEQTGIPREWVWVYVVGIPECERFSTVKLIQGIFVSTATQVFNILSS